MLTKQLTVNNLDLKFDDESRTFSGYASVFGGVDSYGDTIIKGAYTKTLQDRSRPVQLKWNHWGPVIGKWIEVKEDEKGLFVTGSLAKGHSQADDTWALLKHGAISGMSIGYRVVHGIKNANGGQDLHEIDLVEISVVESPADLGAQITDLKSAERLRDVEHYLRQARGFSKADATELVSRIKAIALSESGAKNTNAAEIAGLFQSFKI